MTCCESAAGTGCCDLVTVDCKLSVACFVLNAALIDHDVSWIGRCAGWLFWFCCCALVAVAFGRCGLVPIGRRSVPSSLSLRVNCYESVTLKD